MGGSAPPAAGGLRRWVPGGRLGRAAMGWLLMLFVAVNWVVFSYVVKFVQAEGFPPFMVTYLANSLFVVFLPLHLLRARRRRGAAGAVAAPEGEEEEAVGMLAGPGGGGGWGGPAKGGAPGPAAPAKPAFPARDTLRAAAAICPAWFLAQWAFNVSLSQTSVASSTILSNSSSVFTFFASVLVLKEKFTAPKFASILSCTLGTVLYTFGDNFGNLGEGTNTLAGDAMCLASAALYAVYTVGIRKLLPEDKDVSMDLFFGCLGALNVVLFGAVALALLGADSLRMESHSPLTWLGVVAKGIFDNCLSNFAWGTAILLIGPTMATVGLSLQVPVAIATDLVVFHPAWLHDARAAALMAFGLLFVLLGLLGINGLLDAQVARARKVLWW